METETINKTAKTKIYLTIPGVGITGKYFTSFEVSSAVAYSRERIRLGHLFDKKKS